MQSSIALNPKERKDLIVRMKLERKPSRRLRMHIVLLAADGHHPTSIARVLYCSRTTVYAIAGRFVGEGRAAFEDRERRGPKPLLDQSARERIERLVDEEMPTAYGWLRSRWSCSLLMVQLFRERAVVASRETVRRTLHSHRFPMEKTSPHPTHRGPRTQARKAQRDPEDA
jgi:putative transposase